jgi:hypothetical protein
MSKLQPVLTCVCGAVWEGEMMVHPPRNQAVECMCGICKLGKREWVGLTDEEKHSLVEWAHPDIIEAIELKLKARNT